jgi:two-component system sensor histidine kinase UhpB
MPQFSYVMMNLMTPFSRLGALYHRWTLRLSILNRVLIGNAVVIVVGAVAGTILTRNLALTGAINLILLFSFFGITLSILVNYWIIKTALRPLHELRDTLDRMRRERIAMPESLMKFEDPDISHLVIAVDSLLHQLEERTLQLQAISERAIDAQEEERVRIARGLHDETAQAISMLIIHLERIERLIPEGKPELARHTAEARRLAIRLLDDLRKIIWDLRPSILDDLGLVPAIRWYARSNLESVGVEVEFSNHIEGLRLPSHLETTLFRVAQEAVNNILRHAGARRVSVRLSQDARRIYLELRDDGKGFDVQRIAGEAVSRKHLGLLGIQERVSLVGGEVKVESAPGAGTSLWVAVPIPTEDAALPDAAESLGLHEQGVRS